MSQHFCKKGSGAQDTIELKAIAKELEKRGIKQVVAAARRPQTLGKIERFWGTLWRECVETAVFIDLGDAQRRIGLFIDHYNFARTHSGIDGLTPLPEDFWPPQGPVELPIATSHRNKAEQKLKDAFGKDCKELTRDIGQIERVAIERRLAAYLRQ